MNAVSAHLYVAALYEKVKRTANVLRGVDLWQGKQVRRGRVWLGRVHARWCICPEELSPSSIVYSVGVGEDISFDRELIQRFRVAVHAFDPTPRSIEWLKDQKLPAEFLFHAYGVANFDGRARFSPPSNPDHVSHTMLQRDGGRPAIEVQVYRLSTIMNMLGHTQIDLLKMDVEGAEYAVINDLINSRIGVKQLLVEFHHRWPEIGIEKTKRAIQQLNSAGFRIFDVSPSGEEYSFVSAR
jgi:FkbM family methyltransferase